MMAKAKVKAARKKAARVRMVVVSVKAVARSVVDLREKAGDTVMVGKKMVVDVVV